MLEELQEKAVTKGSPVETIDEKRYFLIVCEGTRTEPIYFKFIQRFLPRHLMQTIEVSGEGDNTLNIVKTAIQKREERAANQLTPPYDEVWAVFDKDDFPEHRYDTAVHLAKRRGIEHGVSNESFELWYILHFQYLDTALNRGDYAGILTKMLGFNYEKNDETVVKALFADGNVGRAIEWAKKLEELHEGKTPSESCPYTRVHILVERLLSYTKYRK